MTVHSSELVCLVDELARKTHHHNGWQCHELHLKIIEFVLGQCWNQSAADGILQWVHMFTGG